MTWCVDRSYYARVPRRTSPWLAAGMLLAAGILVVPAVGQGVGMPTVVQHSSGVVVAAPSDTAYSRTTGLRMEFDTRWPFAYGYHPFRVRCSVANPATAEHRITVRLYFSAGNRNTLEVEQNFDLPLGATEAETTVSCPQYSADSRMWCDVWVDGVRDRELGIARSAGPNLTFSRGATSGPSSLTFLIIGPDSERRRMTGAGFDVLEAFTLPMAELPAQWLDYSAVDVVALSSRELVRLGQSRPEVLTALRRWTRAGGQLWIHSLGQRWQELGAAEHLLELWPAVAPAGDREGSDATADVPVGWAPIAIGAGGSTLRATVQHLPSGRTLVVRDLATLTRLKDDADYTIVDEGSPQTTPPPVGVPADTANWYVDRAYGFGSVRAFRGEWDAMGFSYSWRMLAGGPADPLPPTPVTAAVETIRNWPARYGLIPDQANEEFANLLVPGVGLAPVAEFRVLITLFVLVVGPLNYWLLMRVNRLHLLLVTVPLVALGLTSALFLYALVSDGLSTTVRVRSFTTLDQKSGEAACWARLSYYAGLAPGRGIELPDDVAIYPILPGWNESGDNESFGNERTMMWREGRQQLTTGWLRSRVPTQYLTTRARKTSHRLELTPRGGALAARNKLGTNIVFVAAADDAGQAYLGEAISDGASARLRPATHADAFRKLRQMELANRPEVPAALTEDRSNFPLSQPGARRRVLQQRYNLQYADRHLRDNLLSDAIAGIVESGGKSEPKLPPSTYVAITESGPEVVLGVAEAEEQASFHVLVGSW